MSWRQFAEKRPEMAAVGYDRLHHRIAYLALLNADGSPRVHPVTPFIGDGMLFMFTEPTSPKIRDLRRDNRYAIHCAVGEGPLEEFLVSGRAMVITDPAVRARAVAIADTPLDLEGYTLFGFLVERVLLVTYDEEKRKVARRWGA